MDVVCWILSAVATLVLTAMFNRFLSIFRRRQLYLAVDDVLDCYDHGVVGCTALLVVYNKGRSKEESVEVYIPGATLVQILASDDKWVSVTENKITLERLLPRQAVKMFVYSDVQLIDKRKAVPQLRSKDANGKSYHKRIAVPMSYGPYVTLLSIALTMMTFMGYSIGTGKDPSVYFYQIKYDYLFSQGFVIRPVGDNFLVSHGSKTAPGITALAPYKEGKKIVLPFEVVNQSSIPLYASAYSTSYYFQEENYASLKRSETKEAAEELTRLKEKYWNADMSDIASSAEEKILPSQKKIILFKRTVTPGADLKKLDITIGVSGLSEGGAEFNDYYSYLPYKSEDVDRIYQIMSEVNGTKD